jgi:hypothetical protein
MDSTPKSFLGFTPVFGHNFKGAWYLKKDKMMFCIPPPKNQQVVNSLLRLQRVIFFR